MAAREPTPDAPAPTPLEVAPAPGSCSGGRCGTERPTYRPMHPALFGDTFDDAWLAEGFAGAIADGSEAALRGVLREEVPGRVFSFEMLRPDFCERLLDELQAYEASGLPVHRPNTMNNYGVIVNHIGMQPVISKLQNEILFPLSELLSTSAVSREGAASFFSLVSSLSSSCSRAESITCSGSLLNMRSLAR